MKKLLLSFFLAMWLALPAAAQTIVVAAAADLNYALKDLASRYESKTGKKVILSFGSSGNFFAQIQGGAPYDVFFSADMEYPKKLVAAGLLDPSSLRTYAVGHLVLWVPQNSPLDPQRLRIDLLLRPEVRKIAIADPRHAPYGRAAMAALEHYGLKDKLAAKFVMGENISQTAQFVQSGNAQAGLVALSLASSPGMKNSGKFWILPADSYPSMAQGAGILRRSKQKAEAQVFLDFAISPEGQAVLKQYGFQPPARP